MSSPANNEIGGPTRQAVMIYRLPILDGSYTLPGIIRVNYDLPYQFIPE